MMHIQKENNDIKLISLKSKYEEIQEKLDNPSGWYSTTDNIPIKKVIRYNHIDLFRVEHGYLSNLLDSDRVREFLNNSHICQFLMLDAAPGTGKTYWCFNTLYKEVHNRKKKLLYFASRKALKYHAKVSAAIALNWCTRETASPELLQHLSEFDDIEIYSYQDIAGENTNTDHLERIKKHLSEYGAVVFDEIHAIVSDSGFNPYTHKAFHILTELMTEKCIPRIYMTGTMEVVFDVIYREETKNLPDCFYHTSMYPRGKYMQIVPDYGYINIHAFNSDDEIINIIANDSEDKTLIFINDKEKGKKLEEKLIKKRVLRLNSELLDNPKSKEYKALSKIIQNDSIEDFDVVIATTCLDVGVSIKNKNIRIVSYLTDPVNFIQSIGRKRITNKSDRINLYIYKYTRKEVCSFYKKVLSDRLEFESNKRKYKEGTLISGNTIPKHCYCENGCYTYNPYTQYQQDNYLKTWAFTQNKSATPIDIINVFLKLMKKRPLDKTDLAREIAVDGQTDPCNQFVKNLSTITRMNEQDFKVILKKAASIFPDPRKKDNHKNRKEWSIRTLNTALKPYNYKVAHKKNYYYPEQL